MQRQQIGDKTRSKENPVVDISNLMCRYTGNITSFLITDLNLINDSDTSKSCDINQCKDSDRSHIKRIAMVCVDGIKAIPTLDMEDSKVDVSKRQACEEVFIGSIDFWINYNFMLIYIQHYFHKSPVLANTPPVSNLDDKWLGLYVIWFRQRPIERTRSNTEILAGKIEEHHMILCNANRV
ncbi:Hypothetical predicted protein [Octopus vulgaris]|uniref:Uncharacterized protein n=1 Tax=Octopus vulgaris TaxID=6645 RepID=A0AA36F260_OCTVU|nr:Hypothetical predicted protein [Octopus vulgaris]